VVGTGCSAPIQCSFCWIQLNPSELAVLELNESRWSGGSCERSTVRAFAEVGAVDCPINLVSLNSSFNRVIETGWGSALDVGRRSFLRIEFCRFHSNSPANTIVLWESQLASETYHCLEFFNNSVTSPPTIDYHGLIALFHYCWFVDCDFVQNNVDVLIAGIRSKNPDQHVALVRCIFDQFPTWAPTEPEFAIILETQACVSGETKSAPIDLGSCPIDPRFYCLPHRCGTTCDDLVVIVDCVFLECEAKAQSGPSGGAIYCDDGDSQFQILRCKFLWCTAEQDGGGIAFAGRDIDVSRCFAQGCSAGVWASFCHFAIPSTEHGTVVLNESATLSCNGNQGIIRIYFATRAATGLPAVVSSVNATGNQATSRGTGLSFAQSYFKMAQFCQFSSNFRTAVLLLYDGTANDLFQCLNFFNNTCTGTDSYSRGAFSVFGVCTIRGCLFVGNTIEYLASRFSDASGDFAVSFIHCLFDRADISWSYNIVVNSELCHVATETSALKSFGCILTPSFDASSTLSESSGFEGSDGFDQISAALESALINPSSKPAPSPGFRSSQAFGASAGAFTASKNPSASSNPAKTASPADSARIGMSVVFESRPFGPSSEPARSAELSSSLAWLATALRSSGTITISVPIKASRGIADSELFRDSPRLKPSIGLSHSAVFPASLCWTRSDTFVATSGVAGTAPFRRTASFPVSESAVRSAEFTPSTTLVGEANAAEESSTGIWMGLGIGAAILVLATLAVLLFLFARHRKTEVAEESQGSSANETTWIDTIHEDDEEFVDYVNPLEFSGDRESSSGNFEDDAAE
jgi:hypothetical protein